MAENQSSEETQGALAHISRANHMLDLIRLYDDEIDLWVRVGDVDIPIFETKDDIISVLKKEIDMAEKIITKNS